MTYFVYMLKCVLFHIKTYVGYTKDLTRDYYYTIQVKERNLPKEINGKLFIKKNLANQMLCLMNIRLNMIKNS